MGGGRWAVGGGEFNRNKVRKASQDPNEAFDQLKKPGGWVSRWSWSDIDQS